MSEHLDSSTTFESCYLQKREKWGYSANEWKWLAGKRGTKRQSIPFKPRVKASFSSASGSSKFGLTDPKKIHTYRWPCIWLDTRLIFHANPTPPPLRYHHVVLIRT